MERAGCVRDLLAEFGAPALSGVAEAGVFDEFWRQGLLAYDELVGIDWEWLALDGAIGKAPLGGGEPARIPLIERKKGEAIRPHRGQGVPVGLEPAGANLNDFKLPAATLDSIPIQRPDADPEAAAGPLPRQRLRLRGRLRARRRVRLTPHIRARGEGRAGVERTPGLRARRWVVEGTHSWLNRNRGILIRW